MAFENLSKIIHISYIVCINKIFLINYSGRGKRIGERYD